MRHPPVSPGSPRYAGCQHLGGWQNHRNKLGRNSRHNSRCADMHATLPLKSVKERCSWLQCISFQFRHFGPFSHDRTFGSAGETNIAKIPPPRAIFCVVPLYGVWVHDTPRPSEAQTRVRCRQARDLAFLTLPIARSYPSTVVVHSTRLNFVPPTHTHVACRRPPPGTRP